MISDSYRRRSKKGGGRGTDAPWKIHIYQNWQKYASEPPTPGPWNTPPLEKILNAQFFKTYV